MCMLVYWAISLRTIRSETNPLGWKNTRVGTGGSRDVRRHQRYWPWPGVLTHQPRWRLHVYSLQTVGSMAISSSESWTSLTGCLPPVTSPPTLLSLCRRLSLWESYLSGYLHIPVPDGEDTEDTGVLGIWTCKVPAMPLHSQVNGFRSRISCSWEKGQEAGPWIIKPKLGS